MSWWGVVAISAAVTLDVAMMLVFWVWDRIPTPHNASQGRERG